MPPPSLCSISKKKKPRIKRQKDTLHISVISSSPPLALMLRVVVLFYVLLLSSSSIDASLSHQNESSSSRLRVFVACGFHGREWATVELCSEWQRLASSSSASSDVEWIIVPSVNEYGVREARVKAHYCSRLNRNQVDLNRNFPYERTVAQCDYPYDFYERMRTSSAIGSEEYGGPFAFSERETVRLDREIRRHQPIDIALFVHTGEEAIVMPRDACFSTASEPLYTRQLKLAQLLAGTVNVTRVGPGLVVMYPALGTASDYAFDVLRIPFVYTLETYRYGGGGADADDVERVLKTPTANMTVDECEKTFVPSDMQAYLARWNKLFHAIHTGLGRADRKDGRVIRRWIDEFRRQQQHRSVVEENT
jgi:hypothetical protein